MSKSLGLLDNKTVQIPTDLTTALEAAPKAKAIFTSLSPSHQTEIIKYLDSTRRAEIRARRIAHAVAWLME
jgi:uncharacterized protein YdeI (YjbR/CyaY-like superfamily)